MRPPTTTVVDATETEFRDPLAPSLVAGLEAQGFRVLGRVATRASSSRENYIYDAGERRRLAVWQARPAATLLVAGDGTSYAGVDVFGDAPLVRLRTELTDGSVVETIGISYAGALIPRNRTDPLAGFTAANAPGRSIRLAPLAEPQAVLDVHAQHLSEVGGQRGVAPARHDGLAGAIQQWRLAAAHADACALRATQRVRRAFWVALAVACPVPLATWLAFVYWFQVHSLVISAGIALVTVMAFMPIIVLVGQIWRRRLDASTKSRPPYPLAQSGPQRETSG